MSAAELSVLAEVAYAAGHLDVTIDAWERAHAGCLQAGDQVAAAGAAVRVAMHLLLDTALMAPVRGWLGRAERLLEDQGETSAHAWFAVVRTYERMLTGDLTSAREWAGRAIEVGSKCDPAACAIGRVAEARLLILGGDVREGLALLDEVGVAMVSDELDPLSTGLVYCELVCALQGLAQYDAAEEWTETMERWCKTNAIGSLHGRCRVHRAEILRLRGSCDEAEREALAACEELRPYLRRELGWPLTELGRIRLQRGDIEGAEQALLAAHRVRVGPAARSRAGPTGPRRHRHGGGLDTKRSRAPSPGAIQGAATGHRVAAGAAARGAGRDRDRGRQPRSSPLSRGGTAARCRPIPQQGAGRRRHPCSRKGAARGGRRGGRGTALLRSSATLERGRGAL